MKDTSKAIKVKRLFKEDMPLIEKCYSEYDFLHYNPMKKDYIEKLLVCGQVWAAFDGDKAAACTYMLPASSSLFEKTNAAWEIFDLLEEKPGDILVAGYIWTDENYRNHHIYAAFDKLWNVCRTKKGKKWVLHYFPAHIYFNMEELFRLGYLLRGLRGLDNLVPHYIFIKETGLGKNEYTAADVKICPMSDTKELSKLCEHGWMGFGVDSKQNINFMYRR